MSVATIRTVEEVAAAGAERGCPVMFAVTWREARGGGGWGDEVTRVLCAASTRECRAWVARLAEMSGLTGLTAADIEAASATGTARRPGRS